METIAVFVNDAQHGLQALQAAASNSQQARWILVACPPRLTRHAGRWVSNSARAQWRERWAAELFAQLEPAWRAQTGVSLEKQVAKRPLVEVAERLAAKWSGLRLLDARAPRWGQAGEPISAEQPVAQPAWVGPLAVTTGLSAMLALAD